MKLDLQRCNLFGHDFKLLALEQQAALDRERSRIAIDLHDDLGGSLTEVGLLVKRGRKYYLRASEMHKAIEEIEYDVSREMQRMMDTAKEFDMLLQGSMGGRVKMNDAEAVEVKVE